jgi:dual-specificity kinase
MSTPSIATLPTNYSQYSYAHQNPYTATVHQYPTQTTLPAPPRLAPTYQSYPSLSHYSRPPQSPASYKQLSHAPSIAPSHSASEMAAAKRKTAPDWNEFYKNGVPREIIVIDDDEDASAEPQRPAKESLRTRQEAGSFSSYGGRKRKVDQGYEVEYNDSPTYSTHPAKFGASSSAASYQSGDRTASLQTTTAPTSLESYGSNGANNSYEDVRTGNKRKRVQPERNPSKRKRQESVPDAFTDYVPPAKPVKKSAEVSVPVIRDNLHKNAKVDDDDGHYVVHPNSVMTDRCESSHILAQLFLTVSQTISLNYLAKALLARSSKHTTNGRSQSVPSKSFDQYRSTETHLE